MTSITTRAAHGRRDAGAALPVPAAPTVPSPVPSPEPPGVVDATDALAREAVTWATRGRHGATVSTSSHKGSTIIPSSVETVTSPATNGPLPPMRTAST